MTNLHDARVEAAAKAIADTHNLGLFERYREGWVEEASAALAAADALVTVEMIADEIAGHPIGSGYYQTTVDTAEAREIASAIIDLIRGETETSE